MCDVFHHDLAGDLPTSPVPKFSQKNQVTN